MMTSPSIPITSVMYDPGTHTLTLTPKGKVPNQVLQLSINANGMRNNEGSPLCQLSTQIVTPPGHFIVLGVTPTDATTSVFVVQLLLPK